VLAVDVHAHEARPAFDYSAMDGYVLALGDLTGDGPFEMPVVGESRTGGELPARVEPGSLCRIFTGAPVPPRGEAVLMQEDVTREGDVARFAQRPRAGQHIRRRGEDLERGALALAAGTRIGPQHIAMLATLDRARVEVARRPVVSILSTGDELRDAGERDRPGAVVDSNGPTLAALVAQCGGVARRLPFARDDLQATREALRNALEGADLVLTVGGVSVGDHDVVKPALADVGIVMDFWKVAIRPGKPLAVGHSGAKRFLGLPGNPASAVLTFQLFGAPLLRTMQGDRTPVPASMDALLDRDVRHSTGRLEFARAALEVRDGALRARVLENQASGSVTSLAWADGLVMLDAATAEFPAGSVVRTIRFADV
jgi:molybdopterin molybdotransferase